MKFVSVCELKLLDV